MTKKLIPCLVLAAALGACGSDEDRTVRAAEVSINESGTPPAGSTLPTPDESAPVIVGPVTWEDAETTFRDKRYDEALAKFTAYTETKPENPWGFYMLGLSAWKAGDHTVAEQGLRQAAELDSTHVKSRLNLGRVLMETNRHAESVEFIQQAIELEPTSSEGFRLLARAYDGLGRTADAIVASKRAIVLDGRDVWALNNLGTILIREGRIEEALGPLARAVELEPGMPTFQNNFGMALERTGFYRAAAEAYRTAIEIDSTYGKPAISLARVEQLTEDTTRSAFDRLAIVQRFLDQVETWRSEDAEPTVG
jgi:predicted Zn-dependent protease